MSDDSKNEASIFNVARKIESSEERRAYLEEACGDDSDLRRRVEILLSAFFEESQFLEKPAPELGQQSSSPLRGETLDQTVDLEPAEGDFSASLNAGLAATFCEESAVVVGNTNHSVLKSMSATLAEVPRVSLREPKKEGDEPIQRPSSPEIPNQPSDSRYQLHGEIARGGMGAVLRGRDTDLGRDLAVKVLLDAHKDKPEVVQRFIEEAQIGGQLQHPGIAPVYELGQFADERPFFSMKLVKGDTLSKLLLDREDPATDRSKLIGIFEQVCQTMAYAHSRGVIHRDLKPANIMVGAFGEVQVMDWGLAKVLPAGGVADEKATRKKLNGETMIQTMRSLGSDAPGSIGSSGSETQEGSVMGTPAYMPPEQALGEIDLLDQRADVFGLGAILAEILTGQPPYVAEDGTQIYRMASRGKLGDCFTRLDECGADDELITLAKQCLEVEPGDRLKDANALADQVTGYLESVETKLRESEVERAGEAARVVEQRKRFRVTLGLSAAALTILLAGIVATAWQAREAKRQTRVAQSAREEATKQRDIARDAEQQEATIARQRRRELYAANMQLADQLYNGQNGEQLRIEQLLASWIPIDDSEEDLREFSWRYQWNRLHKSADVSVAPHCKGVAISPDNNLLVTDSNGLYEVDESGNKHELISWTFEDDLIEPLRNDLWTDNWSYFSPDGRWVAINAISGIELYHIESRKKVLSLPQNACSFSSNGKYFAAFKATAKVDSLADDEDAIPVWKLEQDGLVTSIDPLVIGDVTQLPDAGASLNMGNDGKSFLLRHTLGRIKPMEVGLFLDGDPEPETWPFVGGVLGCAWSPDGRIVASAGVTGNVELRLASDVTQKLTVKTHGKLIQTVRFSSDGKVLATAGGDGTIDVWDISELTSLANIEEKNLQKGADAPRVSSLRAAMPRLIRSIKAHVFAIPYSDAALTLSTDGKLLASQDSIGNVKLWGLADASIEQPAIKVAQRSESSGTGIHGSESRATFNIEQIAEDRIGGGIPVQLFKEGTDIQIDRISPTDIVEGSVETGERIAAIFDSDQGGWKELNETALAWEKVNAFTGPIGTTIRLKLENSQSEQHEVTLRRTKATHLGTFSVAFS
ncbi:MAG: protein kinase, partial [Planctomycetota bacterium]